MTEIADLPDDALMPMSWVRKHFVPRGTSDNRDMTTPELAAEFGHSSDWWQDRARDGRIPGCYQSGGRGRWYIPRQAATVYLANLRNQRGKRRAHKAWKGPKAA